VWACTPSAPLTTSTAQSSTGSTRSVSAEKSTWPGVSSSVNSASPHGKTAPAAKIVMPRRRSRSWVSSAVEPRSTRPMARMTPLRKRIASLRVVFPASTWASTPKVMRLFAAGPATASASFVE